MNYLKKHNQQNKACVLWLHHESGIRIMSFSCFQDQKIKMRVNIEKCVELF